MEGQVGEREGQELILKEGTKRVLNGKHHRPQTPKEKMMAKYAGRDDEVEVKVKVKMVLM